MKKIAFRWLPPTICRLFVFCLLAAASIHAQKIVEPENGLAKLFDDFKKYKKMACGSRQQAIAVGKKILEKSASHALSRADMEWVAKQLPIVEQEERKCRLFELFETSYKEKDWLGFFPAGRQILSEEGESPVALEVMITLAAVGYDLATVHKTNRYNAESVFYAQLAIEKIESGIVPKKSWGVFKPYDSKQHALGWLNYIAGYLSYFYLNDKKEAYRYFYQAAHCQCGIAFEATVYHAAAVYYFNQGARLATRSSINDFTVQARQSIDYALAVAGDAAESSAKINEEAGLYKKLVELYRARYALEQKETIFSLEEYLEKLIERPLQEPKFEKKDETAKTDQVNKQ